jgi:ATP-dependent protease ClpP protease subunit
MVKALQAQRGQIQNRSWFSIKAQSETNAAEVLIYDYIGWGGVTAADFAKELKALNAQTITVRLNTPGGDVFDGLAIYNSLKDHGATIKVKIDGLAASIGSIIAMAGSTITMCESAFLMIHNPWALVIGNAKDMREMADTLDKIGGSLAGVYATRKGVSKEQAQAWMNEERWFTARRHGLRDLVPHRHAGSPRRVRRLPALPRRSQGRVMEREEDGR